jgi:hypothetical protein
MAFDVYVFDLFAAPRDRHDFLDWVRRTFRDVDGPLAGDPTRLTPALRGWHAEMVKSFPGERDPNRFDADSSNAVRNASYRFTATVIQASFDWDSTGPALYRARRAAQANGVGLFEASSDDAAVWMISNRNRWEVVHRADGSGRTFG